MSNHKKTKKIYIIRHAKSSWKDLSLDDFNRPLNKRGRLNAPFMGNKLKNKKVSPDLIISSPALRAKNTAEIIAKKVKYLKKIVFEKDVYDSSERRLHKMLTKLDDENSSVFLVGHNPDINMLAEYYVGFEENIVTCGVVEIEFSCKKWADISKKNAKFISFDYPKRYENEAVDAV